MFRRGYTSVWCYTSKHYVKLLRWYSLNFISQWMSFKRRHMARAMQARFLRNTNIHDIHWKHPLWPWWTMKVRVALWDAKRSISLFWKLIEVDLSENNLTFVWLSMYFTQFADVLIRICALMEIVWLESFHFRVDLFFFPGMLGTKRF